MKNLSNFASSDSIFMSISYRHVKMAAGIGQYLDLLIDCYMDGEGGNGLSNTIVFQEQYSEPKVTSYFMN